MQLFMGQRVDPTPPEGLMKDLMIQWEDDHTYEHEDGTWSQADDAGDPIESRYATEDELHTALWAYMAEHPDCYLPIWMGGGD